MHRHSDFDRLASEWGIHFDGAMDYLPNEFRRDYHLAMDAQPTLVTTPNSGIPAFLTTLVDPQIIRVLLAPNKGAQILGEVRKGSWLDQTAMFPVVERTGEVSTYGDRNTMGRAGINMSFPQRQSILYQLMLEWGQLEMERAGLARIGWAAEVKEAGVMILNKYQNLTYFFGVLGIQNYGLTNDPSLSAYITPAPKAAGGTAWISGGRINATANEVYADIQAIFYQLVAQGNGLIAADTKMVLAMSPQSEVALTATNTFNVNVFDLLKKNFPNIRFETAIQYGVPTASNPQGITGGNVVQLIAEELEGQDTGFCAFNEKLRSHPIIVEASSFKQKLTQGSWGAVIRMPFAIAQMQGV